MALVPADQSETYDFECICGEASIVIKSNECECEGDDLYFCLQCEKMDRYRGKKYCCECGPMTHGKKSKRKHKFKTNSKDVVKVKKIIESDEDDDAKTVGMRMIKAMIGIENFNKMEPFLDKCPSLASNSVGAVSLAVELAAQFSADAAKKMVFGNVALTAGIGVGVLSLCELGYLGLQYTNKKISGKEFLRLAGKTVVKNAAVLGGMVAGNFAGSVVGAKVGAMAGAWAGPAGVATGAAVGFLAGIFIGLIAGKGAASAYDWIFPENQNEKEARRAEQKLHRKMTNDALMYFHYQENDVHNKNIFNKKELRKRFRRFALEAHPDRRNGDQAEWAVLSTHYGVLTGLCEENDKNKAMIISKVSALTLD